HRREPPGHPARLGLDPGVPGAPTPKGGGRRMNFYLEEKTNRMRPRGERAGRRPAPPARVGPRSAPPTPPPGDRPPPPRRPPRPAGRLHRAPRVVGRRAAHDGLEVPREVGLVEVV